MMNRPTPYCDFLRSLNEHQARQLVLMMYNLACTCPSDCTNWTDFAELCAEIQVLRDMAQEFTTQYNTHAYPQKLGAVS